MIGDLLSVVCCLLSVVSFSVAKSRRQSNVDAQRLVRYTSPFLMRNTIDQIKHFFASAQRLLVCFGFTSVGVIHENGDAIAATLALSAALRQQKKDVVICADDFQAPPSLAFLDADVGPGGLAQILAALPESRATEINIDVAEQNVKTLSYDVHNGKLSIRVVPERGVILPENVSAKVAPYNFDGVCVLGAPDVQTLGRLYHDHTALFGAAPVLNIDCSPENDHFGHLNLIDVTASSIAEVVYTLIQTLAPETLDAKMATAILTGMIARTKSFKAPNINARTLTLAAELVAVGADRERIVRELYRSRRLSTLKLWGAALMHLVADTERKIISVILTRDDFVRADAKPDDLNDLIDEIATNSPEAKIVIICLENPERPPAVQIIVHAERPYDARLLLKPWNGVGTKINGRAELAGRNLNEAMETVLVHVRENMGR
ncbi:MAG: exopolyphosphatase-like protein, phosphoesterase RecJ protein [Candidatus Magasanikbacteria bacterium]|nr:exopolyphosphatase-like protein, phosphoesterase RecJ protein [Candidatus Magasanikbacteria bacterium]